MLLRKNRRNAVKGKELEMSLDASDLYSIERRLERVADEMRKRNEIETQKLELLKQFEKNLSDKDKE